eukprot:CAMPEP_0185346660 /NCGR_PEP_ID=MMETSP1364-20130426/647_1 /TAXON_ID=38817 /ORGANISM="Gephyrocapsa oceanica, Strain RCC1303" /LENGTH=79 /DNA_ID=CAMNT_0027945975 /DNA_START=161 /DNA_END=398 /DNA_ORIENTATION=-
MLPLGKEFDASASTGEAAAVDDLHRRRCCRRNNGLDSEAWRARRLAQTFSRADKATGELHLHALHFEAAKGGEKGGEFS